MKSKMKYFLFIFFELALSTVIIVLAIKIYDFSQEKVKGMQYVARISTDEIIFSSDSGNLKYFYEPKPNSIRKFRPKWLGYEVENSINSDSINSSIDYTIFKPSDIFRIITLGDSFTFGLFMKTNENWPSLLEKKLNKENKCKNIRKIEVINLGVDGYDVEYSIEHYRKRGKKYDPDLMLWLVNLWNLNSPNELLIPIKDNLISQGIPRFDEQMGKYIATLQARKILNNKYGEKYLLNYTGDRVSEFVNTLHRKLIFIVFDSSLTDGYLNLIEKYPFINLSFRYQPNNQRYFLKDGHPNKEGHKKIADDVYNYLINNIFTGCSIKH